MNNSDNILNKLIPFKKRHSISEAVFSIFLSNTINDPKRFEKLIKEDGAFKDVFQSFKILKGVHIDVQVSGNQQSSVTSQVKKTDDGFQFESYNDGKPDWVIRFLPNQSNPIALSLHCLNYNTWDDFYERIFNFLSSISDIDQSLYASGYSLNYIDQFDWLEPSISPTKLVFKDQNKYLPKRLAEVDGVWNVSSTTERTINNESVIEHINVGVKLSQDKYSVFLVHHVASGFKENKNVNIMCQEKEQLRSFANQMHSLNKEFLKDVLKEDVIKMIGL